MPASVLLLDGELHRLFFGERLDTMLALPGGDAIEDILEGLFLVFTEITSKGILYQLGLLTTFPARPLDENPVNSGLGSFHERIIRSLLARVSIRTRCAWSSAAVLWGTRIQ